MADTKVMFPIRKALLNTQGATGEMLSEGLGYALQDGPEDRHELQVSLLQMVEQVLTSAQCSAQKAAGGICQQKVDTAEATLKEMRAAVASASEDFAAAKASAATQKEKLEHCRHQQSAEEEEHARVEAMDQEKAKEVAAYEQGKAEVVALLVAMAEKGSGEAISTYLRSVNAETPLLAALRSVLEKEPVERTGFDCEALAHLQRFLEQKVSDWDTQINALIATKANIHAEMLGAWAIKELAADHVREAVAELESVETAVVAAQQHLKQTKQVEQEEERVLSECLTELTLATERARECGTALEVLERLVKAQDMAPEASVELQVAAEPMEVDANAELAAAKLDVMLDAEMGTAVTA